MISFKNPQPGDQGELLELSGGLGLEDPIFRVDAVFRGGMGVCLKVSHSKSGRAFALKSIYPEHIGTQLAWARFFEELKVWITLSECNGVAEALHISKINEVPCMCAAWLAGGNLRTYMEHGNHYFFYTTIIRIVRTLEWVLKNHNVIHRDIKPENILLNLDNRAYVADWGLARTLERQFDSIIPEVPSTNATSGMTQAGEFLGTVLYASPEQIRGLPNIDHRSDIYSIGCMMYEWQTGNPPYVGGIPQYIAYQHIHEPVPQIVASQGQAHFGLDAVIRRCLEKSPDQRYHDYNSLALDILEAASTYCEEFQDYSPSLRYRRSPLGGGELRRRYRDKVNSIGYGIISIEEIDKYVHEAHSLMSLGQYAEAANILKAFYIPEIVCDLRQWTSYVHTIAVNYAFYLSSSQADQAPALEVFDNLSEVEPKSPEYFVNYSLALIRASALGDIKDANQDLSAEADRQEHFRIRVESVASEGLSRFPNDVDLLGNLSIVQSLSGNTEAALQTSLKRLALSRSIHALEEAGGLLVKLAENDIEDWPKATSHLKMAVRLLTEARDLNPRYIVARSNLMHAFHKLFRFGDAADEVRAICDFSSDRSLTESAICTQGELLNDIKDFSGCIEFCENWIPRIQNNCLRFSLRRVRAKVLAEHYCLGVEMDGNRVVIPDVLAFYAEAVISKAMRSTEDLVYYARLLDWVENTRDAEFWFHEAEATSPISWYVPYEKAMFLFRRDRVQEAFEQINKSIDLAPFRPDPLDRLSQLYSFLGMTDQAASAQAAADDVFTKRKNLTQMS